MLVRVHQRSFFFRARERERERERFKDTPLPSPRPARSKTWFVDVIDRGLIAEIRRTRPLYVRCFLNWTRCISTTTQRYYCITNSSSSSRYPEKFGISIRNIVLAFVRGVFPGGQSRSAGEINRVWWSISGYAFDSVNGNKLLARKGRRREPTPGFRERFVMDDRRYTEKWWWMKSRPRINIGRNLLHVNNV